MLDVQQVRKHFPILKRQIHGKPLIYFDNAATTQKPLAVIEAMTAFYEKKNANVHRGVHQLSEEATQAYEAAREKVRLFLNAKYDSEIIFTKGTTEAINLVAQSFLRPQLQAGDQILITQMEHHANIVPWQLVAEATGACLRYIPMDREGTLDLTELEQYFTEKTKLFACTHISNALGTINPVQELVRFAQKRNVPVLLDGAQATPHLAVDVQALNCDFYCFSGHKMYGPTGIGVLYGRKSLLDAMPPYQGGGDMIRTVSLTKSTFADCPAKFEAGTPPIAEAVGLAAAIAYLTDLGLYNIQAYENSLRDYWLEKAAQHAQLSLLGKAADRTAIFSFAFAQIHPHDLGTILDQSGIAIRTGHHCAMLIMDFFAVPATARASLAFYNTVEEIDLFFEALKGAQALFL